MTDQEIQANYGTEQFEDICSQLTIDQLRFVTARLNCGTDKEAAETIGVSPDTVVYWKRKGAPIDDAVKMLAFDGAVLATEILSKSVAEAAAVKRAGLQSDDERVKQSAASEIMDRVMGRAAQTLQHTGADGGPIETKDADSESRTRAVASLAQALGTLISGAGSEGDGDMDAGE